MLKRLDSNSRTGGGTGDGARPASGTGSLGRLRRVAPFSSLQRQIIFFNLIGLALLVVGMTYLWNNKRHLMDVYVDALRKHGEIIAIGIAETASVGGDGVPAYDIGKASTVLARLSDSADLRIRLYDRNRRLTIDTYDLETAGAPIEVVPLAPPAERPAPRLMQRLDRIVTQIAESFLPEAEIQYEVPTPGVARDLEVWVAAKGEIAHRVRVNSQGETVVSVAMPVTALKSVMGVLQLSTTGGELDRIIREERRAVLEIFVLAAIVSLLLSVVLAKMIASPISQLARAVHSVGANLTRPLTPDKPQIPDLTHRPDEIGELSAALARTTEALYARIDAIGRFAADVAHELKNPLSSLRSAVEAMGIADTPERRQRLLDVVKSDVIRMDRLLTDISNASRLDAELVRERMEPFDLAEVVETLVELMHAEAEGRGVRIETQLPPGGLMTHGLERRIAQVVTNLLENAISFSPAGGAVTISGSMPEEGSVRLAVEDQGPGIPPGSLEAIFDRFYSERPEGEAFGRHSGLGLSIARQIVAAHGGRIWAENVAGPEGSGSPAAGTRFVVELPQ